MRFSFSDLPPEIASRVGDPWDSVLPATAELTAAWRDPFNSAIFGDGRIAVLVSEDARNLATMLFAKIGVSPMGVISEQVSRVRSIINANALNITPVVDAARAVREAIGVALDAVDEALDLLGSIPIYGWIADFVLSALRLAMQLFGDNSPTPPPFASYDKGINDGRTSYILNSCLGNISAIGTYDWGFLFRPISRTAPWVSVLRSAPQGQSIMVKPDFGEFAQGACAPEGFEGLGLLFGLNRGITEINVTWSTPCAESNAGGVICDRFANLGRPGYMEEDWWWKPGSARTWDTTQLMPSQGNLQKAVASAVLTQGPLAFNMDTRGIANAWVEYMDGFRLFVDQTLSENRNRRSGIQQTKVLAITGARSLTVTGKGYADRYMGEMMSAVQDRQRELIQTPMVAYASRTQAAFNDPSALATLNHYRSELLNSPDVMTLVLEDIPDSDYRAQVSLIQRQITAPGLQLRSRDVQMRSLGSVSPAPDVPSGSDVANQDAGLDLAGSVSPVVAMVGAAGVAALVSKLGLFGRLL